MGTEGELLEWNLDEPPAVEALEAWILEQDVDLQSLRFDAASGVCTFLVTKTHPSEARPHELKWWPFSNARTIPAYVYELKVLPIRSQTLQAEEGSVQLLSIKSVEMRDDALLIVSAVGTLTLEGRNLTVQAALQGRHDHDQIESGCLGCLGSWWKRRP